MDTYRLFIAVAIPEEVKRALEVLQQRLERTDAPVRWVRPASMHLTLKFLGDTDVSAIPDIKEAIELATDGKSSFTLLCAGTGFFPDEKRPRVAWAGLKGEVEKIISLQNELDEALEAAGFEKDKRPFSPHLTIGRIKTPKGTERLVKAMAESRDTVLGSVPVEKLILFRSELLPKGAVHTRLYERALG